METEPYILKKETWLEKIFSVKGRLNRKRYFLRALCLTGIGLLVLILLILTMPNLLLDNSEGVGKVALNLIFVCMGAPLALRRLHDLNLSGWWLIGYFVNAIMPVSMTSAHIIVGIYCAILSLYALLFKGTDGPNRYGEDPLK